MTRHGSRSRDRAPGRRHRGSAERAALATPHGARVAVYPGSFDPVTRGHEDLIRRALTFADRVIVAVAVNEAKQPLFTLGEGGALLPPGGAPAAGGSRGFPPVGPRFTLGAPAPSVPPGPP